VEAACRLGYFYGYGAAVGCPKCGAGLNHLQGWHAVDERRDDEYAGVWERTSDLAPPRTLDRTPSAAFLRRLREASKVGQRSDGVGPNQVRGGAKSDVRSQLTAEEALRCQIGTSKAGRGGRRYRPYAFTEQGVAMLSGVLKGKRAAAVNIEIMRAFVELRRAAASYEGIERRLRELERETDARLGKHDEQLGQIFEALRQLIAPPPPPKRRVGFGVPEDEE